MRLLLSSLVFVTSTMLVTAVDMDTVYQWKYIDYVWESETKKQEAISTGEYNYTQVVPMDVNKASDGRVFISLLGMKGVPAVLATVSDDMGPSGPLVKPYPNWSYFKKGSCDTIQNVYRIAIDECERLWVLDTGFVEKEPVVCEPQLLAFDLKTDSLINRIKIPKEYAVGTNNQSLLATPIVETYGEQCENTTVYMADPLGFGLVIWNNGNLSRLENYFFGPSEHAANITAGKFSVQWPAGIVTMDLTKPLYPDEQRLLYFHPLASFDLYAASTWELKRSKNGSDISIYGAANMLDSQAVGVAFSSDGTFFMGLTKESAIACWSRYKDLKPANVDIASKDDQRLQFINGMKTFKEPNTGEEELWAISNRLTTFKHDRYDFNEYNFYIVKKSIKKLVEGTLCTYPDGSDYTPESKNENQANGTNKSGENSQGDYDETEHSDEDSSDEENDKDGDTDEEYDYTDDGSGYSTEKSNQRDDGEREHSEEDLSNEESSNGEDNDEEYDYSE